MSHAHPLPEPLRSRRHLAAAGVGLAVIAALSGAATFAPEPSGAVVPVVAVVAPVVRITGTGAADELAGRTGATTGRTGPTGSTGSTGPMVAAPPPASTTPLPNGPAITALAQQGIPIVALQAYQAAAAREAVSRPTCHLSWTLVAAIGAIESGHGSHGGAQLYADGQDLPRVIGPVLDGTAGNALITDTDGGRWDGDAVRDHAVGPMQFIPSTWARLGVDANGDGVADPFNIIDAAATAGDYLCRSGGDLGTDPGRQAAVFSYNHVDAYVATVLALDAAYAGRPVTVTSPNPPAPVPTPSTVPPTSPPPSSTPPTPTPTPSSSTPPVVPTPTPTPTCPSATPTGGPTPLPTGSPAPTPTGCPTSTAPSDPASSSTSSSTSASASASATPTPTPTPTG